jgi:hypothetical protein
MLSIIEDIIFFGIVITIAWFGRSSSPLLFTALFACVIYGIIRIIATKKGMERGVWWYSLNMFIIAALLYYFVIRGGVSS